MTAQLAFFHNTDTSGHPEEFTVGERHYDSDGDTEQTWDMKTDIIAWFKVHTTFGNLKEYTHPATSGETKIQRLLNTDDELVINPRSADERKLYGADELKLTADQLDNAEVYAMIGYRFTAADILKGGEVLNKNKPDVRTCFHTGDPIHITGDGLTTHLRKHYLFANYCATLDVKVGMAPSIAEDAPGDAEVLTYTVYAHGEEG